MAEFSVSRFQWVPFAVSGDIHPYFTRSVTFGTPDRFHDAESPGFWEDALEVMLSSFRKGLIPEGICKGVIKVGELIKTQYPSLENDINELGDEVILEE
ncbi:MAG: hypothetical protein ABFC30_02205 [Proteiniphilum sp.]